MHGVDGKTVAAVCMLQLVDATSLRSERIDSLDAIIRDPPDELRSGTFAGEPAMVI